MKSMPENLSYTGYELWLSEWPHPMLEIGSHASGATVSVRHPEDALAIIESLQQLVAISAATNTKESGQ